MNADATTEAPADAIELLTEQHREVRRLWSHLQTARITGSETQNDFAQQIVTMLSQHDALETQLLYPELRSSGGEEGRRMSDHSLKEHQQVRELLSEVDGQDVTDERVFGKLSACITMVMDHVAEEEREMFPLLRSVCDESRLVELGRRMATMEKVAPTHPHPHTPDSKLGATIAGTVSGVMDRARDAVRGAGKKS